MAGPIEKTTNQQRALRRHQHMLRVCSCSRPALDHDDSLLQCTMIILNPLSDLVRKSCLLHRLRQQPLGQLGQFRYLAVLRWQVDGVLSGKWVGRD